MTVCTKLLLVLDRQLTGTALTLSVVLQAQYTASLLKATPTHNFKPLASFKVSINPRNSEMQPSILQW